MAWTYKQIQRDLARHYPMGHVWTAYVREREYGVDLNGNGGPDCDDVEGFAVDLDGNGHADRFLFDGADGTQMSITAADLDHFLNPFASFNRPADNQSQICTEKGDAFKPAPFPYAGHLLPDSSGRIVELLFSANRMNSQAMAEFIKHRPDVVYNVQVPMPRFIPPDMDKVEKTYYQTHDRYLPTELAAYDQGRAISDASALFLFSYTPATLLFSEIRTIEWPQDRLFIGKNEFGESVVTIPGPESLVYDILRGSYFRSLSGSHSEFSEYDDNLTEEGGDVLSTSSHVFRNGKVKTNLDGNFWGVFASGRRILSVDTSKVPSAAHLDMILTPTDDSVDGKPLIFVAKSTQWWRHFSEARALDAIASDLETQGFYVERLPCVFWEVKSEVKILPDTRWIDSYNNVLMERYEENGKMVRHVYMPWYEDERMQGNNSEALAAYKKHGYEITPIHGLDAAAVRGGSLRCLVKVLERDHL